MIIINIYSYIYIHTVIHKEINDGLPHRHLFFSGIFSPREPYGGGGLFVDAGRIG